MEASAPAEPAEFANWMGWVKWHCHSCIRCDVRILATLLYSYKSPCLSKNKEKIKLYVPNIKIHIKQCF